MHTTTCQATTRPDGASGGGLCTRNARPGCRTCTTHKHLERVIPVGMAWKMIEHVADVRRNKGDEAAAKLVVRAQSLLREAGKDRDADELPDFVPAPVRRLVR